MQNTKMLYCRILLSTYTHITLKQSEFASHVSAQRTAAENTLIKAAEYYCWKRDHAQAFLCVFQVKREAVTTVYESKPMASDHQVKEENQFSKQIS